MIIKNKVLNIGQYSKDKHDDIYIFAYSFFENYEIQKIFFESKVDYRPIKLSKNDLRTRHYAILHLYQDTFNKIISFLNSFHKVNLPDDYWHFRIAPWLIKRISLFVDRWIRLEKLVETGETFNVDVIFINNFSEIDYSSQSIALLTSYFNFYTSSLILKSMNPVGWNLYESTVSRNMEVKIKENPLRIDLNDFDINGLLPIEKKFLKKLFYFRSPKKRKGEIIQFESTPLSETILNKINLFEYFRSIFPTEFYNDPADQKIDENSLQHSIVIGTFGGGLDSVNKQIATWISKSNFEIYMHQHGSAYGDLLYIAQNYILVYHRYRFITWGWKDHKYHEASRLISLPFPIITRLHFRRRISKLEDKIILISSVFAINDSSSSSGIQSDQLCDYISLIQNFLVQSLSASYQNEFYWRPRITHNEYTFQLSKFFIEKNPKLKIITDPVFHNQFLKAKLVIIDNTGSLLHKSLAANIPTIILWTKESNYLVEELDSVFEIFKKEGVLFFDAHEASRHIENIYFDVNSWWYRPSIQNARKKFVEKLCPVDYFYFFKWAYRLSTFQ